MSERGKYWKPKDFQYPRISEAPTLKRPTTIEKSTEDPVQQDVQKVQKETRFPLALALGSFLFVGSAAGTTAYFYTTQQGPFAPKEQTVETAPTAQEETDGYPDFPLVIKNRYDLESELDQKGIAATAEDFDFTTGKADIHMKALRLMTIAGNKKLNLENSYSWQKITQRIEDAENDQFLVALQLNNPYAIRLIQQEMEKKNPNLHAVAEKILKPEGYRYTAMAVDRIDPTIVYVYYNTCTNPKASPQILAQIGMPNPAKPKSLMTAKSFNIPECLEKEFPVESDAQTLK